MIKETIKLFLGHDPKNLKHVVFWPDFNVLNFEWCNKYNFPSVFFISHLSSIFNETLSASVSFFC